MSINYKNIKYFKGSHDFKKSQKVHWDPLLSKDFTGFEKDSNNFEWLESVECLKSVSNI